MRRRRLGDGSRMNDARTHARPPARVYARLRALACAQACARARTLTCTPTRTRTHPCTPARKSARKSMRTRTREWTRACTQACTRTLAHARVHKRTSTQAHTHTHTHTLSLSSLCRLSCLSVAAATELLISVSAQLYNCGHMCEDFTKEQPATLPKQGVGPKKGRSPFSGGRHCKTQSKQHSLTLARSRPSSRTMGPGGSCPCVRRVHHR